MNGFVVASMLAFVAVWLLVMAWKSGRLKSLGKEFRIGPRRVPLTRAKCETYSPRRFQNLAVLIIGLCTIKLAYYIGNYLFLCLLYTASRVRTEKLHFISTPNGHQWLVSNGDQIPTDLRPLRFVIYAAMWLALMLLGSALIVRLLPKRKVLVGSLGNRGTKLNDSGRECTERRLMSEKGRAFRMLAFRFLAYWALAMVILGILAERIGWVALVLILCTSVVFYIVYIRFRERQFLSMMIATACPQCGQVPMRYENRRDENGDYHLLICDKCRVEWDLGPV